MKEDSDGKVCSTKYGHDAEIQPIRRFLYLFHLYTITITHARIP